MIPSVALVSYLGSGAVRMTESPVFSSRPMKISPDDVPRTEFFLCSAVDGCSAETFRGRNGSKVAMINAKHKDLRIVLLTFCIVR